MVEMENQKPLPKKVLILRWIARIWSLAILALALMIIFTPDPNATGEPTPAPMLIVLGLLGASILGLLIAWVWERVGAWIAIVTLVVRDLLYIIFRGSWFVNFLLFWLAILPPAVMFLLAWHFQRKEKAD
jgi:hypothetical protein